MFIFDKMKIVSFISLLLLCVLSHEFVSANQNHADDWIDPLDMVNFDPTLNKMKYKTVSTKEAPPEISDNDKTTMPSSQVTSNPGQGQTRSPKMDKASCAESYVCPTLFKQYIRRLLYHIDGKVSDDKETLNMRLVLSPGQIETLKQFSSSDSMQHIHNAHTVITDMIQHIAPVLPEEPSSRRLWLEDLIGIHIQLAVPLTVIAIVVVFVSVMLMKIQFSWWKVTTKLLFLLFCVSVIWTWYELYKREEAKTHHAIMKEMPLECRQKDTTSSIWSTVKHLFTSTFTFETDNCVTYYEHMLIDPLWRVAPTEALAVTFVRLFLAPLRHIGKGINEFMTALLNTLPLHLWPVVLISIGMFIFILLFMIFGYSIHLPLISIRPVERAPLNTDTQQALRFLTEEIKALKRDQEKQPTTIREILHEDRIAFEQMLHDKQLAMTETVSRSHKNVDRQVQKISNKHSTDELGAKGDSIDVIPDTVGTLSCT